MLFSGGCSRESSEGNNKLIENYSLSMEASGPLRIHPLNPRYFTDGTGKVIYLTGSHFWENFQDLTKVTDFGNYLDFLQHLNQNFIRFWVWETPRKKTGWESNPRWVPVRPIAYQRTKDATRGKALDGNPRFDLDRFNEEYFTRLRERVMAAKNRGIYVSIMLFQGYSPVGPDSWAVHPFNKDNNINNIDGDLNGNGTGEEIHTLASRSITALQEAYVAKVIDTVHDLDNVLYEIANEDVGGSSEWQYHLIHFIKKYESKKGKTHPVGMTYQAKEAKEKNKGNTDLYKSPADWISPGDYSVYGKDPPANDGKKVILLDTDHIFGIGGDRDWVWKSFLRGHNPIYMDAMGINHKIYFDSPRPSEEFHRRARNAMGDTLAYARRIDLANMVPRPDLVSSGYCLANPGQEYLIYLPGRKRYSIPLIGVFWRKMIVDLTGFSINFRYEWFDPEEGRVVKIGETTGGAVRTFNSPFKEDAVLYLVADK